MKTLKKIGRWIKKHKVVIIIAIIFLALGAGIGAFVTPYFYQPPAVTNQYESNNPYHFINPLLSCGTDQNIDNAQTQDLQNQLQNAIKAHTDEGDITEASLYFHDLNYGPIIDINAEQTFSPASLLKVPLAISIYKESEDDPTVLGTKLVYTGQEANDPQYYAPTTTFTDGSTYTVDELIDQMLENSDNNAANLLAGFVGASDFDATYQHLGIPPPPLQGTSYTTTTRSYAAFFSILYNATYLSANDSEHLLDILSQTHFDAGIVAGVPVGTVVSHKFGERSFSDSNLLQLHDCGIVYVPMHPYLLCIMTQGYNYNTLASTIADLSNVTYNYIQ